MKKKIIALCLVVVLAVTAVTGATLAYFTDNDAKTNTFTVGDVKIHIDEWMKDEDGNWDTYTDNQKLSPIAQSKAPFNKLVETVNDGSEAAYIRTFITCPMSLYNQLGYGFNKQDAVLTRPGNAEKNMYSLTNWTDIGVIDINGVKHAVFMCEYTGVVEAGESVLSLTKVWVYENVDNADIAEDFEVKVYSEAIQSENLTYEEAMASLNGGKTDLEHAAELFN